jgi:hypothetical protein
VGPPAVSDHCVSTDARQVVGATFVPSNQTEVLAVGSNGGCFHLRDCQPGEVLVGVVAKVAGQYYTNGLTELYLQCALVSESGGAVTLGAPALATPNSGFYIDRLPQSGDYAVHCPPNTAVVGARVDKSQLSSDQMAGPFVSHLELSCAQLSVVNGKLIPGAVQPSQPSTPTAPLGDWGTPTCPAGQVASGASLWAGEVYEGFGPNCVTLQKP